MQDLVQVRSLRNGYYNNHEEPVVLYSSSENPNFFTTLNPLEYQEQLGASAEESSRLFMMQHHHHQQQQQYGSYASSLTDFHSPQQKQVSDFGNWRNSTVQHQVTDRFLNNATNSLPCVYGGDKQLGQVMHHTPTSSALFQNHSLQEIVKSINSNGSDSHITSLMHHNNAQEICVVNASELQHQPNQFEFGWKNQTDSNPQSLSLSLSSKAHVSQFKEEDPYVKPSFVTRDCGKPLQDLVVGSIPNSKTTTSYGNVGPLGPFTGYATILKNSRFLKTAQNLLSEVCCPKSVHSCSSSSMFHGTKENRADWGSRSSFGVSLQPDYQQNKAKLVYMQEEVNRRYKQYQHQMQMVFSSFESVAGLNSATPYITLALKLVSKHFKGLNNSISNQLKLISEVMQNDSSIATINNSTHLVDTNNVASVRWMDQSMQKSKLEKVITGFHDPQQHHVWRPQRGFPERAVAILRAWLFEHFLHPYPTDTDKHMLATKTGLSRNQVSNWFINARVRVWKPMVEEVHMLDQKTTGTDENSNRNEGTSSTEGGSFNQAKMDKTVNRFFMHSIPENPIQDMEFGTSIDRNADESELNEAEQWRQEKRSKLECEMSSRMDGTLMDFLPYRHSGHDVGGSLGSVSLTLGLRHGVEGVQHQDVQFRHHHHLGGQMIHDFVG
ncbi:BEL1-like homeodomain protein 8 [Vicia villosa]|uniref:BEL1-like homeodomain protein 8 n=1 Tax=Vicia villosa TaxID=3911 RepID=UPI00273CDEF8|nr:BEL1-like homeodomain protein 8 [Vicia villosa]